MLLSRFCAPYCRAGSVTFGDPNLGEANAFPFSGIYYDASGATRYQQVYAGAQFGAGVFAVNSITFFNGSVPANLADGTYIISLSTTAAVVGALDSSMANNVGSDNQVIFDGSLVSTLGTSAASDIHAQHSIRLFPRPREPAAGYPDHRCHG